MASTKKKAVSVESEEAQSEVNENIVGLDLLKKEFLLGKMPHRKLVALKARLIELYNANEATEAEAQLMETILKKDRARGDISDFHFDFLNRIEMARCTEECIVKVDTAPSVHYLNKDQVCKFSTEQDDKGNTRFAVYVERKISPENQMTRELVLKEQRGHFPSEDEYPKERILIHKLNLKQREFNVWFDIVEDELSKPVKQEVEYVF